MTPYRTEQDSLGEKQIPKDAYYGIQSQRALENFPITHYDIDSDFIKALAIVKKACAQANRDHHGLDPKLAKVIEEACDELIEGKLHDQFVVDPIQGGAGTSLNMNANEVIANRALELLNEDKGNYATLSPNSHVNQAQSTNDAIPTAFRIAVLFKLDRLILAFEQLQASFTQKASEFDHIIKMGRTHLQDAIPIRLGQEFAAYASSCQRSIRRLKRLQEDAYFVNIGATAVGTGLNAKPDYIEAAVLNLQEISGYPIQAAESLVDATQNTDFYSDLSSALKTSMLALSKIANDLRLMASGPKAGLNEINLPERQPGSSIMPGKVNPVMPELINQINFQVLGNDATVSAVVEAGQFELNVMGPVLFHNILESMTIMTNGIQVFCEHCIDGITTNEEVMADYVERSVGIITVINPHIGYEKASKLAKKALQTGKSIQEILEEENIFTSEDIDQLLDPHEMTSPGIIPLTDK